MCNRNCLQIAAPSSRKGQILYGKSCGERGPGHCALSFALYQLRQGNIVVVHDLLRFLDDRLAALRDNDPEEVGANDRNTHRTDPWASGKEAMSRGSCRATGIMSVEQDPPTGHSTVLESADRRRLLQVLCGCVDDQSTQRLGGNNGQSRTGRQCAREGRHDGTILPIAQAVIRGERPLPAGICGGPACQDVVPGLGSGADEEAYD